MAVVLIGPPASGKSRVGRRLAARLEKPYIDTDKRIVADHGPIPQIFATHGERHFRALERAEVSAALAEDAVVSLGGGAVLDPDTRAELGGVRVVLLTISEEAVAKRIDNDKRPLIKGIDSWRALVAERMPVYRSLAHHTVDTSDRPVPEIVEEIASWVRAAEPEDVAHSEPEEAR